MNEKEITEKYNELVWLISKQLETLQKHKSVQKEQERLRLIQEQMEMEKKKREEEEMKKQREEKERKEWVVVKALWLLSLEIFKFAKSFIEKLYRLM